MRENRYAKKKYKVAKLKADRIFEHSLIMQSGEYKTHKYTSRQRFEFFIHAIYG